MSLRYLAILLSVALAGCGKQPDPEPAQTPPKESPVFPTAQQPDDRQQAIAVKVEPDADVANRAKTGLSAFAGIAGGNAIQRLGPYMVTPSTLVVSDSLSFKQKVLRHAEVLEVLKQALEDSQKRKAFAVERKKEAGMLEQYLAAEEDEKNTFKYLAPYAVGQAKAKESVDKGNKLTKVGSGDDWKGEVCNPQGQCEEVDPIVALFMMVADAVIGELNKEKPFGPNNDLHKILPIIQQFIEKPLGGPNSDLVKIRNSLLAQDERGEIAKLIREPGKRPIEIVQNIRDGIVSKDNQGEIAKAIRDPIKCTVGHLWGGCN